MADGKVIIEVNLDDSKFESSLEKFKSKAGGVFKGIGTGFATAIATAGTAVGTLGAIGVQYNAEMESYTTNLKVLLGDEEKAISKVNELKEMAAKTPFEMTDLADATQVMLSFGIAEEDVGKNIQMLGDVSLGNSEKMKSLTLAFSQVSSTGKLTGQDLMQMINAGFNPLQVMSQKTGKSMAELKDEMSKGAISAEDVAQAFKDATSEGGAFYNGMEEASKTTEGLISTLKDNAVSLVGEVFQPISDSILQDILPSAIGYIDELSTAFNEGGVEGLIEAGGRIIADIVTGISENAPKLIEVAVSLIQSLVTRIKRKQRCYNGRNYSCDKCFSNRFY